MSNYADGTCIRSCGCRIHFEEDDFKECRLHANAAALLAAAKAVRSYWAEGVMKGLPGAALLAVFHLAAAVEAAEGRKA